jgi:NADPH:quinone reductase-like Zn-dependent oxidoreductase
MKAIVWTKYGSSDGLLLKEVKKPSPKDHEILIKVKATTVTAGDCEIRTLKLPLLLGIPMRLYFGLLTPNDRILGQEFSGIVEKAGKDVTTFQNGDHIFGTTGFSFGAYAQYVCLKEKSSGGTIAIMPSNMTFEQAAGIPVGGLEALHFFKKANIKKGARVLINGAGGSIGTIGIQLAKHFGAIVTGVDRGEKFDVMYQAGADDVIDYTKQDFTQGGKTYDVVFDVVGKSDYKKTLACLNQNGRYLLGNPKLSQMLKAGFRSKKGAKQIIHGSAEHHSSDLDYLCRLIEKGKIKSIIGQQFPLEKVAEAHAYVEKGLKKGNLIITVD